MDADERDLALLRDMRGACAEIIEFMQGVDFDALVADRMRCLAVERALEIIGEAAGRVSADFQRRCAQVPWRKIKGMRNILAHEYGHIEYSALFDTAKSDVPALLKQIDEQLRATGKRR